MQSAVMRRQDEGKHDLERRRRHREEVNPNSFPDGVVRERPPDHRGQGSTAASAASASTSQAECGIHCSFQRQVQSARWP